MTICPESQKDTNSSSTVKSDSFSAAKMTGTKSDWKKRLQQKKLLQTLIHSLKNMKLSLGKQLHCKFITYNSLPTKNCSFNFSIETENELKKIRDNHATCLADIPVGVGTQYNEAMHKKINMFFQNRATITYETAEALVMTAIFGHNNRKGAYKHLQEEQIVAGNESFSTHASENFKKRQKIITR